MKITSETLLATLLLAGCSSEAPVPTFDIEQNTGMWVLYEIVGSDGTRNTGPIPGLTVFGAYDSSVQLNDDGTYVPLNWMGPDDIMLDEGGAGAYEYFPDEPKLVFTNSFCMRRAR